jgi:hypothetical protein
MIIELLTGLGNLPTRRHFLQFLSHITFCTFSEEFKLLVLNRVYEPQRESSDNNCEASNRVVSAYNKLSLHPSHLVLLFFL